MSFGTFGNSFGASAAKPAQPTTSLFGAPAQPQAQASTSLFGQPQQQQQSQPSTGLFGSTPAAPAPAPATGGGLFGSATNNTGGGLFGAKPATTAGTGLFGASTTAPAAPTFSFGAPATSTTSTQQPATGSSSLFGGGLFGNTQQQQPQQQQQQTSLFGSTNNNPLTLSQLGANNQQQQQNSTSKFGPSLSQSILAQSNAASEVPIEQQIEKIKNAFDPNSPTCAFQYYFYNLVPSNQAHLYARPARALDDALWFKAERANPDPKTMVPALAVGWGDVKKRVDVQVGMAGKQHAKLQELSTRLTTLQQKHSIDLTLRLQKCISLQQTLSHRLLHILRILFRTSSSYSSSNTAKDEVWQRKLEAVAQELDQPGGMGKFRGRMTELWALLGVVRKERERALNGSGREGWGIVDEEGMERLAKIIQDQQTALAYLIQVIKNDNASIEVLRHGLGIDKESSPRK